jgi:hypothetical protein
VLSLCASRERSMSDFGAWGSRRSHSLPR